MNSLQLYDLEVLIKRARLGDYVRLTAWFIPNHAVQLRFYFRVTFNIQDMSGHNRFPHFLQSSGSAKNLTNQSCLFLLNRFDHSNRLLEFPGAGWAGIPRNEIFRRGYLRDRPVELFYLNPYQCNNRGSFQIHYTQGQLGTANNKFGVVIGTHFDVKQ